MKSLPPLLKLYVNLIVNESDLDEQNSEKMNFLNFSAQNNNYTSCVTQLIFLLYFNV